MYRSKFFFYILFSCVVWGQIPPDDGLLRLEEFRAPKKRQILPIPGWGGFQTLKCDFHMHTVFSDGQVWPVVRIQEAWSEGLDAVSITDHREYTPYADRIAGNPNSSYELAKDLAAENNLLLLRGVEVTRPTPPGHFNALFIEDASGFPEDRSTNDKDKQAILKAGEQKAFIFWNHPGWKVDQIAGSYEWLPFLEELYREKLLHGIEVCNGFGFHKKALDWCIDKNLTVLGSTDVHSLVKHEYALSDTVHRTMTLVFAKERTAASVREALEAGRTVAWASKYLVGKEEYVRNLFQACVEIGPNFHSKTVKKADGTTTTTRYYEVKNLSALYFELELRSGTGTAKITLFPLSSQVLVAPVGQQSLTYEVMTTFIRSDKHLLVDLPLR